MKGNSIWVLLSLFALISSLTATFFGLASFDATNIHSASMKQKREITEESVLLEPPNVKNIQKTKNITDLSKTETLSSIKFIEITSNPFSQLNKETFQKKTSQNETTPKATTEIISSGSDACNAIASVFRKANPRISKDQAMKYAKIIVNASREFDVNPFLIGGIIVAESTVKETAISRAGAVGLMQIHWKSHKKKLPRVFGTIRSQNDLMKPENNIRAGAWLLSEFGHGNKSTKSILKSYLGTHSEKYQQKVIHWKTRIKNEFEKTRRIV